MFYVYLLYSKNYDQFYVGSTNDLRKRVKEHNEGRSFATKRYLPWKLIYYEAYQEEYQARMREKRLKAHGNAIRELKKRVFDEQHSGVSGFIQHHSGEAGFTQHHSGEAGFTQHHSNGAGFTLVEMLLVVVILALVVLAFLLTNWRGQIDRGYDAKRKSDIQRIQTAFEDYYNDHSCYPPLDILNTCNGTQLQPYLDRVPCDPQSKQPYKYEPMFTFDLCKGYKLFASLTDKTDEAISQVGCSPTLGCGYGASYNWGLTSGGPLVAQGFIANPSATPTPTPKGGGISGTYFACSPIGACKGYSNPQQFGCPVWFTDNACSNACGDSINWCQQ